MRRVGEFIHAAHDLFVSKGYGRTSMVEAARAAGVAVETVYGAFGTSPHSCDRSGTPPSRGRTGHPAPGPAGYWRCARRTRPRNSSARPRCRPYPGLPAYHSAVARAAGAATSEPAAAAMLAEFDERRLDAARHYARAAAATGLLGVSEQECSDLLAATLEGALWYRLVEERGWSEERFAQLLGTCGRRSSTLPNGHKAHDRGTFWRSVNGSPANVQSTSGDRIADGHRHRGLRWRHGAVRLARGSSRADPRYRAGSPGLLTIPALLLIVMAPALMLFLVEIGGRSPEPAG